MIPLDQADLFGGSLPSGLRQLPEIVDTAEERALIARIDAEPLEPFKFQGWLGKRLTRSFGVAYDFDRARLDHADPIPPWLLPLRARAASFTGVDEAELVQALLIRYDPGAGIGWHKDRPAFDQVVGISLGASCAMRMRRRRPGGFDRATIPLNARAAYHLSGEARHAWEHGIAPLAETRWSITFRSLAPR